MNFELATLGGGCFWCLEAVYQQLEGVESVVSGYAGDSKELANYRDVCSGMTKHAEVIQISFDPEKVTFEEILKVFWTIHDPTTLNRQGNDVGPQYRSVIFYHDENQKTLAENSVKNTAASIWDAPITTEVSPLEEFFPAENYHQNYYDKTGSRNPYCTFVITPKVTKFKKQFADKLKK